MSVLEDRVYVAGLIRQVLISRLCVREAILNFPRDTEDKSIQSAFHALVHYEADEDLRNRDALYKEEQDDYIEFLSYTLEKGESLPQNIIENYKNFYESAPILHKNTAGGFLKSFFKMLNIDRRRKK